MPSGIVKYDNRLNTISLQGIGFTDVEYRVLCYMCMKALNKGTDNIVVSFSELKKAAGLKKNYTKDEFKKIIDSFYEKLKSFQYVNDNKDEYGNIEKWIVFYGYSTRFENNEMEFSVSPKAVTFFNQLNNQFTAFEYRELLKLRTTEGMNLFRQLKQWKTVGKKTYTVEEIRKYLDISDITPTKEITRKLYRAIDDLHKNLPETYSLLIMESIKNGRKITGYKFTFRREERYEDRYEKRLSSKNTLRLYRLLQEHKNGYYSEEESRFKAYFGVPHYSTAELMSKILAPCVQELQTKIPEYYDDLTWSGLGKGTADRYKVEFRYRRID